MATIANTKALTVGDGASEYVNVDTVNKILQIKNAAKITLYSDDGTTAGLTLTSSGSNPVISATSPDPGAAGTITTASVGIARVTPVTARTGIIMQAGTVAGQSCWVVNEATTVSRSLTFDVSGTSNVADGINNVIYGNQARHFTWDASTSLWMSSNPIISGSYTPPVVSATSPAIAGAGTVTTAAVGVARVTPTAARTGIIMQAGTINGQSCWVVNEATTVSFSITFDTSGTSNVADGANNVIYGNQARLFIYDTSTSLWYASDPLVGGSSAPPVISSTSPAIAGAGTVTTASVGVARVTPTAARTGIIMQAGTIPGQSCWVVNEATTNSFSITFDVSGTSNVADGVNNAIYGNQARLFVWDASTSLWYDNSPTVGGTIAPVQSATAAAIASSGTVTTSGVGIARLAPAAAVTGIIMQAGTIPGQLCAVVNEAVAAFSATFATSGTSNVADGVNNVIPGLQAKLFIWDAGTSLWYTISQTVNGALNSQQSASATVISNGNTITTSGVGVARVAPGGAVTGIILGVGTITGQEVWIVNESVAASTITLNTTPATANVADSATEANIPGLKARHYVWDASTSLWYPAL
jgi:hypothetical protein